MRRSASRQSQDSRRSRRRTNSGISVTEAQFDGLQLVDGYSTTTIPSVANPGTGEAGVNPSSQAEHSSRAYLTSEFDITSYSPNLNQYYSSSPASTAQVAPDLQRDMSTYRYAYPAAVSQYDIASSYGSTYQSVPVYDYSRTPATQIQRSDSNGSSMYGRNLSVQSTDDFEDDRQRRSHSSSRRSRERSMDPYQAVASSGPDLSLSGHYGSTAGIAPASMIVPSQRTTYPEHYPGTTSASAGPHVYATDYTSTSTSYSGGNLSSSYDINAVDPSSLFPTSRARSTSGASADLSRSGSFYRAASGRSSVSPGEDESGVRVIQSRPKPQCWDHGCNGRQFSTFSNLLRHQRERAGTAAKPTCPHCGAEFTRTTARNGHMQHEKCRSRRGSND